MLSQVGKFLKIFGLVFVAEIGDKTSLATIGFAATTNKSFVFFASSLALIVATLISVHIGGWLNGRISPRAIDLIAGGLFILIGLWKLIPALKA